MKNQLNALLLSAALAGLTGGTTVASHAQGKAHSNTVKAAKLRRNAEVRMQNAEVKVS